MAEMIVEKADRKAILHDLMGRLYTAEKAYMKAFKPGKLSSGEITAEFMADYREVIDSVKKGFKRYVETCGREPFSARLAREYVKIEDRYNNVLLQAYTIGGMHRVYRTLKTKIKKEPTIAGMPVSRIKRIGEEAFGKDEEAMESFLLMLRTDEYLNGKLYKDTSLSPKEKKRRIEDYIREGAEVYRKSPKR